ncbi:IclR family transcriptional regulator [Thalassococcus sp. S3]|uniref:IclR family transcriptional regulator n=1 Tax=Thalassococcus sp. S3 TaxID=2017482 RepID=UPI0013EE7CAE|nr:helix-turn-helix domain-containing protein [Thalassococcus sp. S3]
MNDLSEPRGRGVQSVAASAAILEALANAGGPTTLKEIAASADMAPAKVHRYLVSLCETGLVTQRPSGLYDLGPAAARIGISAVSRVEPVNRAADMLPELVDLTGATAMLSVFGHAGPTVVRWERARPQLITALGVGSVLPLERSATGQVFLGWLPKRLVHDVSDLPSKRAEIRSRWLCTAAETYIPGLYALAVPVLDLQGDCVAAVTLISTDAELIGANSPARQALNAAFDPHPA